MNRKTKKKVKETWERIHEYLRLEWKHMMPNGTDDYRASWAQSEIEHDFWGRNLRARLADAFPGHSTYRFEINLVALYAGKPARVDFTPPEWFRVMLREAYGLDKPVRKKSAA